MSAHPGTRDRTHGGANSLARHGAQAADSSRERLYERAAAVQSANRVRRFRSMGVDLIIGRREGYRLEDISGRAYWDCHLNGGTYSFGHRHPTLTKALLEALETLDVGNHHFVSPARVALAEALTASAPGQMKAAVFTPSGAEATDVAVKSARWATGRRSVIAIDRGYHGRSGISGAAGDDEAARYFLSDDPETYLKVPFNDLDAMERALESRDVACVLMETIPATYGFPPPDEGYLAAVAGLCRAYGAAYIADEVQTGLGRTGSLWGCSAFGVAPDMMITGKALSGGLYPVSACLLGPRYAGWLDENGWGYVSTFGGAEPGCVVGAEALKLAQAPATADNVSRLSARFADAFADMRRRHACLRQVRQTGLVIGLVFDGPDGGVRAMKHFFDHGVWAIFASFDPRTLQFKPGLLLTDAEVNEICERMDNALTDMERTES